MKTGALKIATRGESKALTSPIKREAKMKAVISVIGRDKTGIIYKVSKILYESDVNIEDISQTIMQGNFTMLMLVNVPQSIAISELKKRFEPLAKENLSIQIQKTEIFDETHHI